MDRKIFKFLETPFNNYNIEVIENGLFKSDSTWNYTDIISPFNRLYFILSGGGTIANEQGSVHLVPGNIYLIPEGTKYSYSCSNSIYKLYLHFNLQIVPGTDVFEELNQCIFMPCSLDLINRLIYLLDSESLVGLVKFNSIINGLISELMEKATQQYQVNWEYKDYGKYVQILSYISDHLFADTKISEVAERMKVSYYSLSRNFKKDTGFGIKEYTDKMLFRKSKQLLLTSTMNITEISEHLHFCDPYYFSRFFKKFEAISPREYRKKYIKELKFELS